MKLQINVAHLEEVIRRHRAHKVINSDLSDTIVFERAKESDTHLGSDEGQFYVKSKYAECNDFELTVKP